MSTGKKSSRSWFLALFGLPFLLAGLGVLIMGPLDTLRLHAISAGWERVPVQVQHVNVASSRAKNSTTYKVEARYRYEFGGRAYHGTRVSYDTGSDGFLDEHDERAGRLRQAMNRGEPVLAWVNPADPQQAFLLREVHWKRMLLMTVFALLFGGVGGAITVAGVLRTTTKEPMAASGPVIPTERYSHRLWWGMGLLFVLITVPAWLEIPKQLRSGNLAILLVLVFPLAGAWMLWLGTRGYRNWRHHGPLLVEMDPQPGQLGGDVGGRIQLRVPYQAENPYRVTLQCMHARTTERSRERNHSESLLWQEEQVPYLLATTEGTELCFLFQPPANLPQSEPVSDSYHFWRLLLSGQDKSEPLERTYTLPVARGDRRSRLSIPIQHRERQESEARIRALELASEQIRITQEGGGVQIHTPFGLHLGMKLLFLLFGVFFAGAAMFLTQQAQKEGGMLWFMAVVFSLVGYPLLVASLFTLGRALKVEARNGELRSVRYWFGLPLWRRQMMLTRADQFRIVAGSKTSDGRRYREHFHLIATDNGRKLRVADDVTGREEAEALRDGLVRMLGLSHTQAHGNTSTAAHSATPR